MTARRALALLSGAAGFWTLLLLTTGGFAFRLGPVSLSSQVARTPLVIALVSGLTAWALALVDGRSPSGLASGRARRVSLLAVFILGLGTLFLFQPAPPANVNNCLFVRELGNHMRHLLNCDAVEYLALAHTPAMVLTPEHPYRQSRPLSFAAPYVVATPLRLVTWLNNHGIYPPYGPEFVAFASINLVVLIVTMLCFVRSLAMARTGIAPGVEVLLALVVLAANDVTKLFFWSPHTQIYNLFVPCVTIYMNLRLLASGCALSARQALLLGFGLGVGLLMYGSFSVPLICACAIQLLVYRRPLPTVVLGATAGLTYAAWVAYVRVTAGFFYSYETEMFRQFVWLADCYAAGRDVCVPHLVDTAWGFTNRLAQMTMVPLAAIVAVRIARLAVEVPDSLRPANRYVGVAVGLCLGVSAALLLLMGDAGNMPRLFWVLIPPLLLVLAIDVQQLRASLSVRRQHALSAVIFVLALAHLTVVAMRQGPYQ